MSRCEISVGGQLAEALLELIRNRFGEVTTRPAAGLGTTVVVGGLDPASRWCSTRAPPGTATPPSSSARRRCTS